MANAAYQPVSDGSEVAAARLAAINQTQETPAPPPPLDHPMNVYARNLLNPANYQSPDAVDRNRPSTLPSQISSLPSSFQSQAQPIGSSPRDTKLFNSLLPGLTPTIGSLGIKPPTPEYDESGIGDGGLRRKPQLTQESARASRDYAMADAGLSTVGGVFQPEGTASKFLSGAKAGMKLTSEEAAKLAESAQIQGGLTGRIGARGSVAGDITAEGSGPVQTAAQRAGVKPTTTVVDASGKAVGATPSVDKVTWRGQPGTFEGMTDYPGPNGPKAFIRLDGGETILVDPIALGRENPRFASGAAGTTRLSPTQAALQEASDLFNQAAGTTEVAKVAPKFGDAGTAFGGVDIKKLVHTIQETTPYRGVTDFGAAVRSGEAQASGAPQGLVDQFMRGELETALRARGMDPDVIRGVVDQVKKTDDATLPVRQVLADVMSPTPITPNVSPIADTFDTMVGKTPVRLTPQEITDARNILAEQMGVDPITGFPNFPPSGRPPAPPGAGQPPILPPANRGNIGDIAANVALEVNSLFRSALAGGDISTVLLQGGPLLAKDITKLPFYAIEAARGGAQRPYFQSAFARLGQALVAGPERVAEITKGFVDAAEAGGLRVGKDVFIGDPLGPLTAREEFAAGNIIQNIPVLGLLYRQGNAGAMTFLNAMRVGEALNLKRAYTQIGIPFEAEKVGSFVNDITGHGPLPFANNESADTIAKWMQGIFFGPRLMSSAVRVPVETILSMKNLGVDAVRGQSLKPADIARVHATASFVAAGYGAMKLAEASGLEIGTDPTKTNFGRITLPGGRRLDLWGPFNEEARLIAQELSIVGRKAPYGAKTFDTLLLDYARSKLGPVASAGYSLLKGTNQAGQTRDEVIQSTLANPNPLSNPTSIVPAPFTAQNIAGAYDPAQGGQGGGQALMESVLGTLGASILPPRTNIPYDGLGRPEGSSQFGQDPVFDEFKTLSQNPDFSKTGVMTPPSDTIGTGSTALKLPATEADKYITAVGEARRVALSALIYSPKYQDASKAERESLWKKTYNEANNNAEKKYLGDLLKTGSTDPATIHAAAVNGFIDQGTNKDKAYWVALLDKAGKLSSEVSSAIEKLPGSTFTVEEYRRYAPLTHEYLSHVPFGSDAHPIGGPADWTAVDTANKAKTARINDLVRAGTRPTVADAQAQREILATLFSPVQRSLYLNGTQLENPARKALALKYPVLKSFVQAKDATEPDSAYP